jgi:Zn-dependent protease with chaperone function
MSSTRITTAGLKAPQILYARPLAVKSAYDKVLETAYFTAGATLATAVGGLLTLTFRAGALLTTVPGTAAVGVGVLASLLAYDYLRMPKNERSFKRLFEKATAASPDRVPELKHSTLEALRPELEKHLSAHGLPHKIKFIRSEDLHAHSGVNALGLIDANGEKRIGISVDKATLSSLDQRELRGALMHEVGHIISSRFVKKALKAMQVLTTGAAVLAGPPGWAGWAFVGFTWASFQMLRASHQRSREFQADRIGGLLGGDPAAIARAAAKTDRGDNSGIIEMAFPTMPALPRRLKRLAVQEARMAAKGLVKSFVKVAAPVAPVSAPRAPAVAPRAPVAAPKASIVKPAPVQTTPAAQISAQPWGQPYGGVNIKYSLGGS